MLSHLFVHAAEDMQGKTEEEIEMMKMMGFGSFDTTKVGSLSSLLKAVRVYATRMTKASFQEHLGQYIHFGY